MGCATSARGVGPGGVGLPGHGRTAAPEEPTLVSESILDVASLRVEITGGAEASRVAKRPDILEALESHIVQCIADCGNLHERAIEDLEGTEGKVSVFFTNATKKRVAVGAVVKLTRDVKYKQYSISAGLTGTVVDVDHTGDARVDWGASGAQWLLRRDVAAAEVVAEQAMTVGALVVVSREVRYKQYTLQEGLRGLVLELDPHGDARVNWELLGEQWLLGQDFVSVNVEAAGASAPKLAITAFGTIRLSMAHILGMGARLVVERPVVYVDYTLPQGLCGLVTQLDEEGDALVEWEGHGHRWLMRKDFSRVEVQQDSRDHRDWGYVATMESLRLCLDTDVARDVIAETYREMLATFSLTETLPLSVEVFLEPGPLVPDDSGSVEVMEPAQVLDLMSSYDDLQDPPFASAAPKKEKERVRSAASFTIPNDSPPPPAPAFPFCGTTCGPAQLPVKSYQVGPEDEEDDVGREGKSSKGGSEDLATTPAIGLPVRAAADVIYDGICVPAGSHGTIVSLQPSIGVAWHQHPELENAEVFRHQIRIVGQLPNALSRLEVSVDEAPYAMGAASSEDEACVVGGVPVWTPARREAHIGAVVCAVVPGCCAPDPAEGKKLEIVLGAPVHYAQPR